MEIGCVVLARVPKSTSLVRGIIKWIGTFHLRKDEQPSPWVGLELFDPWDSRSMSYVGDCDGYPWKMDLVKSKPNSDCDGMPLRVRVRVR